MSSRNLCSCYIFHKKMDKVLHSCLAAENQKLLKSLLLEFCSGGQKDRISYHGIIFSALRSVNRSDLFRHTWAWLNAPRLEGVVEPAWLYSAPTVHGAELDGGV